MTKRSATATAGSTSLRRRVLMALSAVGVAVAAAGVLWTLSPDEPQGTAASDADGATSTSSVEANRDSTAEGGATQDESSAGDSASTQQVAPSPGPDVSTVPLSPGSEPSEVDDVERLAEEKVSDQVSPAELEELDEATSSAEQAQEEPDVIAEMDSALEDYTSEQESLASDPDDVPAQDNAPAVLDELESDAQQLSDEIAASLEESVEVQP